MSQPRHCVQTELSTDAVMVSLKPAFHGRTLGALSATHSKLTHKADIPAFHWPSVPFPANRWPLAANAETNAAAEAASLAELERILDPYAGRVAGTRSVRLRPHRITQRADVDEALSVFDADLRGTG